MEFSVKNKLDSLFFTRLFVSEQKQIALIADEKLHTQISRRIFATKLLRNEDYYGKERTASAGEAGGEA